MRRRYFVFDASALVFRYVRFSNPHAQAIKGRLTRLFTERARLPSLLDFQIPNICMAECGKAFARICFEDHVYGHGERAKEAFWRLRDGLLTDVRDARIIHSFELHRNHFLDIEQIYARDYQLKPPKLAAHRLSSHDALIISMASWLGTEYADSPRNVAIITADERIALFCAAFPREHPRAINIQTEDPLP